jgi:hypothetical protein
MAKIFVTHDRVRAHIDAARPLLLLDPNVSGDRSPKEKP